MIERFRYLLRLTSYKRKSVEVSVFRRAVGHFEHKFQAEGDVVGVRELEWLSFGMESKYPQCIVWFCHRARVWQTNGQNHDSQDRASIAASRGKN